MLHVVKQRNHLNGNEIEFSWFDASLLPEGKRQQEGRENLR